MNTDVGAAWGGYYKPGMSSEEAQAFTAGFAARDAQLAGSVDEFLAKAEAALAEDISSKSSGIFWSAQHLRDALSEAVQRLLRVREYGLHMSGLQGMSWASMHGASVLKALGGDPMTLAPDSWVPYTDKNDHQMLIHTPSYDKGVRDATEGQRS